MGRQKQHCEEIFRNSVKESNLKCWLKKQQVMPLAHQTSPADFIVITEGNNNLVECKESNLLKSKPTFDRDRLTQHDELVAFANIFPHHHAYVVLLFWAGSVAKSDAFMVPINIWDQKLEEFPKRTISVADAREIFAQYRLDPDKGSVWSASQVAGFLS
jgi:hypothetical protein